jgi:hypothetical protein
MELIEGKNLKGPLARSKLRSIYALQIVAVAVPVRPAPHPAPSYSVSIGEEIESGVRPSAKAR